MDFYGRDELLIDLDSLWGKNSPSLVTCRGRRRIGKSTLIARFAELSNARFIKIEGERPDVDMSNEDELATFAEQLSLYAGKDIPVAKNWLNAFKSLDNLLDDRRTVVLLDEVSWLAYFDKRFAAVLKIAWDNMFKSHRHLVFVVCGSVSTWIKEKIVDSKAYYGRRSLDIVVPELALKDCARFWAGRLDRVSVRDILDILSITGGVPRYLEEVNPSQSVDDNIRRMAFRPDSTLRRDFDEMFRDVITKRPRMVATVLEALADGPLTMTEISGAISAGAGGNVSAALNQLVEAGLVARDIGTNPETGDEIRERRYRLSDNYVRFYLKCIRPAAKTIDAGAFRYSRLAQFSDWNALKGFAFENLIVNHYGELLPHLHLGESHVYSAAPYRKNGPKGKGLQIDLLLQTRRSQCVVEIKRKNTIGKGIVDEVAEKIKRLKRAPDSSVRAALVYDGELAETVPADGYFDAIIPFRRLLGL